MINEINNLPKIYLGPGEFHLSREPETVVTVLGSCISVVMYNTENKICAVSHSVMPDRDTYINAEAGNSEYKFVDSAIRKMIRHFDKAEIERDKIKVKLFGGSEQINETGRNASVGKQNILMAINILFEEGLTIISSDVGGNEGRKLLISTQTGDVYLYRLGKLSNGKNG